MRWLSAIATASLVAAASVNACGGRTGAEAGAVDASIDVATPVGPCGPFDDPDAAGAVCSYAEREKRWAAMRTQPIVPPFRAAGLDMRGPHGIGLTVAEADRALCPTPGEGGSGTFGDNGEVSFFVGDRDGGIARSFLLGSGYAGAIDFADANRQHSYRIVPGEPIARDGAPFTIDWSSPSHLASVDELLRAMAATFAPNSPLPAGAICADAIRGAPTDARCVIGTFGDTVEIYFPTIGVDLLFVDKLAPQPAASTPARLELIAPPLPCDSR